MTDAESVPFDDQFLLRLLDELELEAADPNALAARIRVAERDFDRATELPLIRVLHEYIVACEFHAPWVKVTPADCFPELLHE